MPPAPPTTADLSAPQQTPLPTPWPTAAALPPPGRHDPHGEHGEHGEHGRIGAHGPRHGTGEGDGRRGPTPTATPLFTEAVVVPRLIATACATGPQDAERLVRAAGLPHVLVQPETARTPSAYTYRLWGAVLARTGRPDAGLLAAAGYRPGRLDVFDYLMASAPTVGDGLARGAANIHLISSNSVLSTRESGDEITIHYDVRRGDDDLRWVVAEFALAVLTAQLKHATGQELTPVRVEFAHRAPRRHARHQEAFGAARLEFGATADAITLHRRDLERTLATADPALASIMLRAAAATPPPRQPRTAPVAGLREVIAAQLPYGRPSLAEAARRLTISPRTLQRRLGESGTTWRAELDAVRRDQCDGLLHERAGSARRAARLGFAESRSLRRAMNRWDADGNGAGAGSRTDTEQDADTGTGTGTGIRADTGTGTGADGSTDDARTDGSCTEQEAGTA